MPDTKIAFQKQMCVKARCETARCGEAARSGTTSTNCAEVRGGTDRGRGRGGGIKKGWMGGKKSRFPSPCSPAHTGRLLLCRSPGGPRTKPRCPGPAPSPLPASYGSAGLFPFSPSPSAGCPVRKASILSIAVPANKQTKEPRLVPEINKLKEGREVWKRRERFKMFIYFVSCCKI